MRVLITGHSGLIGQSVMMQLARKSGVEVRPFHAAGQPRDICDPDAVLEAIKGVDVVLHLAGLLNYTKAVPHDLFKVNVEGTGLLIQSAIAQGVKMVVFASSQEVYAGSLGYPGPFTEEAEPKPNGNPYAESKLAGEELCRRLVASTSTGLIILRIAAVYGRGSLLRDNVITRYIEDARTTGIIRVYGEGSRVRDLVWVEDVAKVMTQWERLVGTYNVGGGFPYTSMQIAEVVASLTGASIELDPGRSESTGYFMDIAKLKKAIGYRPVSLGDGLRQSLMAAGGEMHR